MVALLNNDTLADAALPRRRRHTGRGLGATGEIRHADRLPLVQLLGTGSAASRHRVHGRHRLGPAPPHRPYPAVTSTTATNADRTGNDRASRDPRRVRTRTVLQMEAVECGAASLAMVLAHHGRVVPLTELRQACGVSRDGSKASSILKAARTYGLTAKGFRKEPGELQDPDDAGHRRSGSSTTSSSSTGSPKGRVYLNDPASGPRTVTDEEFDRSFTGVVLTFEPSETSSRRGGRFPSLTASLRRRLGGSRAALVYGVLAGLALIIPGLLIPAFSRIFVDDVLVGGFTDWLAPLVVAMALTLVLLLTLDPAAGRHLATARSQAGADHVRAVLLARAAPADRVLRPALRRRRRVAHAAQRARSPNCCRPASLPTWST